MENKEKKWLPHLENAIPQDVFGYPVSMYCIALEGWRRGMTLKFINNNRRKSEIDYSLTCKGKEHYFIVSKGDFVTEKAVKICKDKHLTKKYLAKAGVSIPAGESFGREATDEELIGYANSLGYPIVLKPSKGTGGRGVIANIKNEVEFKEALTYVKCDLNYSELIIETFFEGEDYRVFVLEDKVLAVLDRIPANIIGDGETTVRDLLKLKNNEREKNPALVNRPIKIDKELHNMLKLKSYNLDSVPKPEERVYLKSKNNISAGGDSVDITDDLPGHIKTIAINAIKAIPGMAHGGVDIMVNKKSNTGIVLEVNSRPGILSHMFPMEGRSRDIPKAIIDYYFPETKSNYNQPSYYFDFKNIYESFRSGLAKEYVVPDIPVEELNATRFEVSGNLKDVNYETWVRKQAINLKLNGFIKHLKSGNVSIIVSGPTTSINKFRSIIKNKSSKKAQVTSVVEKKRTSPVKIGFEIINFNPIDDAKENVNKKSNNLKKVYNYQKERKNGYAPVRLEGIPPKKTGNVKK